MKKIIICEYHLYGSKYKLGSHHYADIFCRNGYKVLWISWPFSLPHLIRPKNWYKLMNHFNEGYFYNNGRLLEYVPFTLIPYYNCFAANSGCILKNIDRFLLPRITHILEKTGFNDTDILWMANPMFFSLLGSIKHRLLIYRMADNYSQFEDVPDSAAEGEHAILRKADIVFYTARKLYDKISEDFKSKSVYLPNGVSESFFNYPLQTSDELRRIIPDGNPRIIYVGALNEWFDIELFDYITNDREKNYIVVGRDNIQMAKRIAKRNVYYLGEVQHKNIFPIISSCDVGIIPFRRSELIDCVNPIKMYEYMACNLPVVSTGWYELEHMDSPVKISVSGQDFLANIDKCLEEKKADLCDYKRYAALNTWEKRFDVVKSCLEA